MMKQHTPPSETKDPTIPPHSNSASPSSKFSLSPQSPEFNISPSSSSSGNAAQSNQQGQSERPFSVGSYATDSNYSSPRAPFLPAAQSYIQMQQLLQQQQQQQGVV